MRPRTNRRGSWAMPGDLVDHKWYNLGIVLETSPPNRSPMSLVQHQKTFRVYFLHMGKTIWCLGKQMNIVSFGNEGS